jgi:hypothetical protein
VAEGVMALSITNNRADGVIVVHLSGAIFFDEESTSLRVRVKYLLWICQPSGPIFRFPIFFFLGTEDERTQAPFA